MMFNQAPRCAFLLALAAGLAEDRAQGFHAAAPMVPVGCGALRRGVLTKPLPHAAVRGCTCAACVVATAGSCREMLGGRPRSRGHAAIGMSVEAGEVPAAAVPEFDLTDKTVEVMMRWVKYHVWVCACVLANLAGMHVLYLYAVLVDRGSLVWYFGVRWASSFVGSLLTLPSLFSGCVLPLFNSPVPPSLDRCHVHSIYLPICPHGATDWQIDDR